MLDLIIRNITEPSGSFSATLENSEDVQGPSKACFSGINYKITQNEQPILDTTDQSTGEVDIKKKMLFLPTFEQLKKINKRQTICTQWEKEKETNPYSKFAYVYDISSDSDFEKVSSVSKQVAYQGSFF